MKFQYSKGVRYLTFAIFPADVVHAVFTRQGGFSPEPWNSLNVGGTVGDDDERVRQNRYLSFEALVREKRSVFDVWQVHSSDVVIANLARGYSNSMSPDIKADGIITNNPAVSLFMRFADCTPILLYDPRNKAIGIAHAGWQGTIKRVAAQTVKTMTAAYGSDPKEILAAIGPAIGPDHYEVGDNVIEQVKYSFGYEAIRLLPKKGERYHFDLWEANRMVLEQEGVSQIEVAGLCTACNTGDWFSHRAERGKTGRFGVLMAISSQNRN